MTASRIGRFKVQLDDRTSDMPVEALLCRSMNHPWAFVPPSPSRRRELAQLGQTEFIWYCGRCSSRRVQLLELPNFDIIASRMEYAQDYLVKEKGTGRLPRSEARKAMFVRASEISAADIASVAA
jgi:hypothetical protein